MKKDFNILSRILCLVLMIHLLAMSVCDDYLVKMLDKSTIEQTIEIEKDTDNDTKEKSFEFNDLDDEYLMSFHNPSAKYCFLITSQNFLNSSFQYLHIALPQSMNEILIPPPQV